MEIPDSFELWLAGFSTPLPPLTGPWIRVRAPSRLHFGLLVLPAGNQPVAWSDLAGRESIPARHFGGIGLMVQAPGVQIAAQPSKEWLVVGPQAQRALSVAERCVKNLIAAAPAQRAGPCTMVVEASAPEHCGLGTGTQISLAVARAVLAAYHLPPMAPTQLAKLIDRGRRSSIGIHGFAGGGLVVEGGQGQHERPGQPLWQHPFPEEWKILLVVPRGEQGMHGLQEHGAFANLQQASEVRHTEALCRLVLLGMLPALLERDLPTFSEALFDFNRRAGEMFRALQGGIYAHRRTEAMVDWLRKRDIRGVGQSSWGPTVFAIVEEEQVDWLKRALQEQFELDDEEIVCTVADNHGAIEL